MRNRLLALGFLVLAFAGTITGIAFGSENTALDPGLTASVANWHRAMKQTPHGQKGCFEAEHPNTTWQEVPCASPVDIGPIGVPPTRRMHSASMVESGSPVPWFSAVGSRTQAPGPAVVGSGIGFGVSVADPNDTLAFAEGYFRQVIGVTTISSYPGHDNMYSLQLNSNPFSTPACNGAANPASCQGWHQFVYSNHGYIFMQYWLLDWGKACDTAHGWMQFGEHCYKNSSVNAQIGTRPILYLSTLKMVGGASSSRDSLDFRYRTSDGRYRLSSVVQDSVLNLAQGWKTADYNIYGESSGYMATFNPGSSLVVAMDAAVVTPGETYPSYNCIPSGSTGETNNLNLFGPCCWDDNRYWFFESNTDATNRPVCPPTTQASISSLQGGSSSLSLGWINGDGEATAVFMAATSTGSPFPFDGGVYLQDESNPSKQGWQSSIFGQGSQIGTSGWYCVYNGLGNGIGGGELQIGGLQSGTTYRVMALSYNGYGTGTPRYLKTTTNSNPVNYFRQASNVTATSCASSNGSCMTLGWQNGNGNPTAVFMAKDGTGNPLIDDLVWDGYQYLDTLYQLPESQNTIFGQGTLLPGGNWFCVYNGAASSVAVSGLDPGAVYRVAAISYTGTWNNPTFMRNPSNGWIFNPISFISPSIGSSGQVLNGFDYYSPGVGYLPRPVPAMPLGGLIVLSLVLGVVAWSRLSRAARTR